MLLYISHWDVRQFYCSGIVVILYQDFVKELLQMQMLTTLSVEDYQDCIQAHISTSGF